MVKHFFFVPCLDYNSGWGTTTLNYLKLLNKKDVIIICNKRNYKANYNQYNLISKPLDYIKNFIKIIKDYYRIRFLLKRYKQTKNISHFPCEPYSLILLFCKNYFFKNIYYAQGSYSLILLSSIKTKLLFNYSKINFNAIIYSSRLTKKIIDKVEKFKFTKIKKIINPITYLKDHTSTIIKKKNYKNIICVGHLSPRKGYEELIYVLDKLKKNYKHRINLFIVGKNTNNIYKNKLQELILLLDLKKRVKFFHKVNKNELIKLYLRSDLFVLLSKKDKNYFEGFGIVYLEAIKFCLPIIISKESGAVDLKKYFKKFNIVNPKQYNQISNEIIKIFNNKKINYEKNQNILLKFCNDNEKKLMKIYKSFSSLKS